MNVREQDARRDDHAVEEEGHKVGDNLPHKEEVVDDVELLPSGHPLQETTSLATV